jgi:hypothetical protein
VNDLQLQLADADGLARAERFDVACSRSWLDDLELRIVAFDFAGSQDLGSDVARDDFRAAELLQLGNAAGVIVVHVRVENELDVFDLEPELLHVPGDERRGLRQSSVDQHMSIGRRDQNRAQAAHTHVISVTKDLKRRLFLIPGFAPLAVDGSSAGVD